MQNGHFIQMMTNETNSTGFGIVFDYESKCSFTVALFDDLATEEEVKTGEVTIKRARDG